MVYHMIVYPGKQVDRVKARVASWADLLGPQISQEKIADQVTARRMLVQAVRALSGATQEMWAAAIAEDEAQLTPAGAMLILTQIANTAQRAFTTGGLGMIVHVYLATLKKGNITEAFSEKIISGITQDFNITQFTLDTQACKQFYSVFGLNIDDVNIQAITERWTALLPPEALRLRLTVQRAAGAGITALMVTGRAIRLFDDFNWERVRTLYFDEWVSFSAAVDLVGNNKWYGFKKDLGGVASTKYKNLTYIAKELLIKVNGEASLRTIWRMDAESQIPGSS
ncbi:hypothetical protein WA026_010076 [Henosepilachna vigintioctopunctata]|uniref:Uncharacterized protein n=1 Tax=Henosepilachna vigintioctopunctata TaxID=420089 RepID=A0AAW1UJA1_9CUCU